MKLNKLAVILLFSIGVTMPTFGKSSLTRYQTLHPKLQELMDEAIKYSNFSIICGHRGEKEQNKAVRDGNSKAIFPSSKHNSTPSLAVDVVPWPTQYKDSRKVYQLAGVILTIAKLKGIHVRWGGDWDGDGDLDDQRLHDPYHFELVNL